MEITTKVYGAPEICLRKGNLVAYLNDDGRDQVKRDSLKKQDNKVQLLVGVCRGRVFMESRTHAERISFDRRNMKTNIANQTKAILVCRIQHIGE